MKVVNNERGGEYSSILERRIVKEKCQLVANQLGIKLMIDGPRQVKIFAALQALQGKPRQRHGFFNPRGLFTHSAHADA